MHPLRWLPLQTPQVTSFKCVGGTCLQLTPANLRAAGAHLGNEDGNARPCECEQNNKVLGLILLFKVRRTKGFFPADVAIQFETEISRFCWP